MSALEGRIKKAIKRLSEYPSNAERQEAIAKELAGHIHANRLIIDQVEFLLKQAYREGYFEAYINHSAETLTASREAK